MKKLGVLLIKFYKRFISSMTPHQRQIAPPTEMQNSKDASAPSRAAFPSSEAVPFAQAKKMEITTMLIQIAPINTANTSLMFVYCIHLSAIFMIVFLPCTFSS